MTEHRIMAPGWVAALYIANGGLFICVGMSKLLLGIKFLPFTLGWLVLSSFWFLMAFRLSRIPLVKFTAESLEVLPIPVRSVKHINLQEIVGLKVRRFYGARILLSNGKSVPLPVGLMSKTDRTYVEAQLRTLSQQRS